MGLCPMLGYPPTCIDSVVDPVETQTILQTRLRRDCDCDNKVYL